MRKRVFERSHALAVLLAASYMPFVQAQVADYTFSQEIGTWQPINGNGTPLGMPGLPPPFTFDDNSFVTQGESLPLGSATTGNGWPIGFNFTYNGQVFDRVGLSMEGWLAFGSSSDGANAVYVPVGSEAYTPLSSPVPSGVGPARRNRIAGFAMDLAAMGNGGTWPIQIRTIGAAPNRTFVAEWNVVRSGGSNLMSFQIRLSEGGGDASAQIVKVVYGGMTQSAALNGQVGLGGIDPTDFNNRAVTASPFNWEMSEAGATNTATCRPPTAATNLPQGLTFTWTPPGCRVNAVVVNGLVNTGGEINGVLSWAALAGATSYDYVITTGGPEAPAILSGNGLTTTSVQLTDLPTDQALFAYVRANCGQGPAGWGSGFPFTTEGFVEVVCGEAPLQFDYCYTDLEERQWHYFGSEEATLRLTIHAGTISNGDVLTIHDGPTDQAPVLFTSTSGAVAGQVINSTGAQLTMKLVSDDLGSCSVQEFITPLEWEVGCVDCDPVLATFGVVNDCAAGSFSVAVQVFSVGSSGVVQITNDAGLPAVTAGGVGAYTVGPIPNGTAVNIVAEHAENSYCSAFSPVLTNGACPVVSCGPDAYEQCYGNSETLYWAYSGEDANDRIGIRFISGTLAAGDVINVFDGADEFSDPVLGVVPAGDLTGQIFISSVFSNTVMVQLVANASVSCATGQVAPLHYVVGCYDGCVEPQALFSVVDDCAQGRFSVVVNVTALGSADAVVITNDRGVASTTASAIGQYTVGPFTIGTPVVIGLEGDGPLCSINSIGLSDGCGVGIQETSAPRIRIYPDPSDGNFFLELPHGFGGGAEIEVLDLAGRRVQLVRSSVPSGQVIPMELTGVPAGSYVVVVRDREHIVSGTVRVMR